MNTFIARATVGGFVLSIAMSIIVPVWLASDAPIDDYVATLALVDASGERSRTFLVHPPWRDDARQALVDASQKVNSSRQWVTAFAPRHGDPTTPMIVLADRRHALSPMLARHANRLVSSGRVVAYVIADDDDGGGFRLNDRLHDARVSVTKSDGTATACVFSSTKNAHTCPGFPTWNRVGVERLSSGKENDMCIWAHPVSNGIVSVALDGVNTNGALTFRHAIGDSGLRASDGADVVAEIFVDGARVARSVRTNRAGFSATHVPIDDDGKPHDLEVRIHTENDGARHYCFTLAHAEKGAK